MDGPVGASCLFPRTGHARMIFQGGVIRIRDSGWPGGEGAAAPHRPHFITRRRVAGEVVGGRLWARAFCFTVQGPSGFPADH